MVVLAAYTLTSKIREASETAVYRGYRDSDRFPVTVKTLESEYPSPLALARLRHEHALLLDLDAPGVVKTLGLEQYGHGLALVLEDVGEHSLDQWLQQGRKPVAECLELAVAMVGVLESVHRAHIIHKDIKPEHFFLCGAAGAIKLVDFGISTRLAQETHQARISQVIEGTLAYISPEQTGRMNRGIDRRSDLYSFGVTLYEMLTGQLPFAATDPLQLIHSHIARTPLSPHAVRADIPRVLSEIVQKLLSKVAEDRYQDAAGLRRDLEECRTRLDAQGQIAPFPLARYDISDELRIPQKLYGRREESEVLHAAFARAQAGAAELLLIAGYSGVGKSALVNELNRQLDRGGGFIAGKFDQLGRNVPYAAIAQACRELVRSLLSEASDSVARWKHELCAVLGPNGQVMIDLVPELELLIGPQPRAQQLGPSEAQHRFELVFQNFFRSFTTSAHPLAFYLDDLQWADSASLRLVQLLLTAPWRGHLLLVAAYRDNEVGPLHPLSLAMAELRQAGATLTELRLEPLKLEHVNELLTDTLHCTPERSEPLAALALEKTHGNPFFLAQFLSSLHQDHLLWFDADRAAWSWDLERVRSTLVTDNVVDFVLGKLQRLGQSTERVLRLAACIGHRFDRKTLCLVSERSASQVTVDLWPALREGLVVPLDGNYGYAFEPAPSSPGPDAGTALDAVYRFQHDRVQQAAYTSMDEAEREQIHLRIGRRMLAECQGAPTDEALFEIVGQLNRGVRGLRAPEERTLLARLNLRAGRQARDAAAHATAGELLRTSLSLLGEDPWGGAYELAYPACLTLAECESVNANPEAAYQLLDVLEAQARTTLERAAALRLRTMILTQQNRIEEAAACGSGALRLFDPNFATDPASISRALRSEFEALQAALAGREIESLIELPSLVDPEKLVLLELLYVTCPSANQTNPELMALISVTAIKLALRHGNAALSAYFYAGYGLAHAILTSDRDVAYRFGQLGIRLNARLASDAVAGATYFLFGAYLAHWREPLEQALDYLRRSLRASLDSGDHIHAGYAASHLLAYRFFRGDNLSEIDTEIGDVLTLLERTQDIVNRREVSLLRETVAELRGRLGVPGSKPPPGLDSLELERTLLASGNRYLICSLHLFRAMRLCFRGDYRGSLAASEAAAASMIPGFFFFVEQRFYHAIALGGALRSASEQERGEWLSALRSDVDVLAEWAALSPANVAQRHCLAAAELARESGVGDRALELYDRALETQVGHDFVQLRALGSELCAHFHLRRGRSKVARVYLADAGHAYRRWGAEREAERLLGTQGEPLGRPLSVAELPLLAPAPGAPGVSRHATAIASGSSFDLGSVLKATQAISSEVKPQRLFATLMATIIENAGAERGCLISRQDADRRFYVQARASLVGSAAELAAVTALDDAEDLCRNVVRFVLRTSETVVLDHASAEGAFQHDSYVQAHGLKSLLCMPVLAQGELVAVLYAENNSATGSFTRDRLRILHVIASQAAISIANAQLYDRLEQKVEERTRELARRNRQITTMLNNMDQGIFTVDEQLLVEPEYSARLPQILGTPDIAGKPCIELLFQQATLGPDALATMNAGLRFSFGVPLCLAEANSSHLVRTFQKPGVDGATRHFEVDWNFILDEEENVSKVLVAVREVSLLKQLADIAGQRARETDRMAQILDSGVEAFREFLRTSRRYLDENQRLLASGADWSASTLEQLFRNLHTVKGNARFLGYREVVDAAHLLEEKYDRLRREPTATPEPARLAEGQAELSTLIAGYEEVYTRKLAGSFERRANKADALVRELEAWVNGARPTDSADQVLERMRRSVARRDGVPLGELVQETARLLPALAGELHKAVPVVHCDNGAALLAPEWAPVLRDVFVHCLNNALTHGIESPEERRAMGKQPEGHIELSLETSVEGVHLQFWDDGRGLALEKLRERTGKRYDSDLELAEEIFISGISTAEAVNVAAGRGVGMEAVRSFVREKGGDVSLAFKGEGRAGYRPFALVFSLPAAACTGLS